MPDKKTRGKCLLSFVATFYIYHSLLLACCPVRSQSSDFTLLTRGERKRVNNADVQRGQWHSVEPVIRGPNQPTSPRPRLHQPRPESSSFPGGPLTHFRQPNLPQTSHWVEGNVTSIPSPSPQDPEDGYQADFTGLQGVPGKVLGLSSVSSPHFSEWQAMRPLVECDDNVMIFTASGQGFSHLLVDREDASPISVLQLPSYCGYSVKTSWSDLEMMVPYDACYITQENDSYVLPLLWWGSPLKLSCPMQISTLSPTLSLSAVPAVFCSPYGMAVDIRGQEQELPAMEVLVSGVWSPFVSEQCAYRVNSQSQGITFYIPYTAPCVTRGDDLHIQLVLDNQEYVLSCPVNPGFPYTFSTPWSSAIFPGELQFPHIPDPVNPAPTSTPPPQAPTKEHIAHSPHPGFSYPEVYPPGSEQHPLPQPTPGSPPGSQEQSFVFPIKFPYSFGEHQNYPSPNYQSPAIAQATSAPNLNQAEDHSPPEYPFGFPYLPFYYPAVTQPPPPGTEETTTPTSSPTVSPAPDQPKLPSISFYPVYYRQPPYHPAPTAAQATQTPPPPISPSQPHHRPFYPHSSYIPYYTFWPVSYSKTPSSDPTAAPPPSPTTTVIPSFPSDQFYYQKPFHPQPPTPPPPPFAKQHPQKTETPQTSCPPFTHTFCGYYPYPYHPYQHYTLYPPQHPSVPKYPDIPPTQMPTTPTTTTTTPSPTPWSTLLPSTKRFTTPSWPTPHTHHVQCLKEGLAAFLPFAQPDSIQVRDQMNTWLLLSTVSPFCGYMLQMADGLGVILYSPLPACHSQLQTPTTISLLVRFWDLSTAHYRSVDLQCPHQSTPATPGPVTPSVPPTPPGDTEEPIEPSVVPKTKVFCSSHQMIVELPSSSISEIAVKDMRGNQMKLQEAPKHCGYSVSQDTDDKIYLSLQLHSHCHMSVQDQRHVINIIYMTANGKEVTKFSCPVVMPASGQECNLPSEQRLPCGSGSVSHSHCLSMGCCFNKHPPACYYPMDECTIDRHFVFSVPASLTDPPLNPALLVVASNSTCKPEKVTTDYALFKVPMDSCGTRRVVVGKTIVYMMEVINKVHTITLNYGTITRDSPIRLLVECRFVPGKVLTASYVVKSPTLGPHIHTQGMFGVQLRISKDAQYSSYYPQYHQPLQMLLGKPLYLEVRLLNSPDPNLVLLVHFCVAYPRSGKAVWVLLYNGCPNPLDPALPQALLPPSPERLIRRFTISTFQFLPDGDFKDPNEEIYFMCSTEICSPRDGPCVEGCFGH